MLTNVVPPPIGRSEMAQLWLSLPLANGHRLMRLLTQLLEHRLLESQTTEAWRGYNDHISPRHLKGWPQPTRLCGEAVALV